MFQLTFRSLLDRKIRLALTTFAVVLGVAFVSGAFILADSLRATFDDVARQVAGSINVQIRGEEAFEGDQNSRRPVPESLLEGVRDLPGVASAEGLIIGTPQISIDDELVVAAGPTLGFNYIADDPTSAFEIMSGGPPGPGEVLVDVDSAAEYEVEIGDTLNVRSLAERVDLTVSGTVRFGEDNGAGAAFFLFDTETTQLLFDYPDAFQQINLASDPGVTEEELAAEVTKFLESEDWKDAGYEAVTGQIVEDEFSDQFDTIINIFQNALLGFAVVALVVSAFIINNTFSIVLGQRIKELGLLRTLGATGRQVRASVLTEAGLIGVVASIIGLLGGIGVAWLINFAIAQAGGGDGLPEGPLVLAPRTWIAAAVVGLGVTLLAGFSPARKAATIPPIAALRDDVTLSSGGLRRRTLVGTAFAGVGAVLVVLGVVSDGGAIAQLIPLAGGALLLFVAVALLSPIIARPAARLLGIPAVRFAGTEGVLARENASRSPRRTSATAAALMVGLALVTTVLVIGESFKRTFVSVLDESLQADYFIDLENQAGFGFSPQLVAELNELDEVGAAVGFRGGPQVARMRVEGELKDVIASPELGLGDFVDLDLKEGTYAGLTDDGLLVHKDPASDLDLRPGSTLLVEFPLGERELTVVGVYDDAALLGNWVISIELYEEMFDSAVQFDLFAAAVVADGLNVEEVRPLVDEVAAAYPEARLQDRDEFQDTLENQIDQLLLTVNLLLVFAVMIAVLGIINTLMLSVFERTREIGLLRAVGMTRRQTRRMIRWEAIIVAVFGGVLGVTLGLVFGYIAAAAMPESFLTDVGVPIGQLLAILALCVVVGLLAAFFPARRAAKLNVLDAIAHG